MSEQGEFIPNANEEDVINPLQWVERLSTEGLRDWLRYCAWARDPHPVIIPHNSRIGVELVALLKGGSPELKIRIRTVVPQLLQEWGRDDPWEALDDLLMVCGRLRCAAAEPFVAQIASERLRNRKEEVPLRQRCLSVLSGFGCSERTAPLFKRYIGDVEYAAICYRALYRHDWSYAASELPSLVSVFRAAGAIRDLDLAMRTLARDIPNSHQLIDVLIRFLRHADPEAFIDALEVLRVVNILSATMFVESSAHQRAESLRLLLQRVAPADLRAILLKFEAIGIELHAVEREGLGEYIQGVVFDPSTNKKASDPVINTGELREEILDAIIRESEPIAMSWAYTFPKGPDLN